MAAEGRRPQAPVVDHKEDQQRRSHESADAREGWPAGPNRLVPSHGVSRQRIVTAGVGGPRAFPRGPLFFGDAGALAFVAEVDRRLGLYQDALDGFRAAQAKRPDDLAHSRPVRRLENLFEKTVEPPAKNIDFG